MRGHRKSIADDPEPKYGLQRAKAGGAVMSAQAVEQPG
jgi:hypothetical protein